MYTNEPNAQVLLALLRAHGVRTIVASPGTTNMPIVASAQKDDFFQVYSVVDERSAGYVAVGLSSSLGEPVALSCTGATASRNYMSAMTEAYYRKLPLIAITSMGPRETVGHLEPQMVDRSVIPRDVALLSVRLPTLRPGDQLRECAILVNRALLETRRRGGGPVHIDLSTTHSGVFDQPRLPDVPVLDRFAICEFIEGVRRPPVEVLLHRRVVVAVGGHAPFSERLVEAVEGFAQTFDAPVLVDQSSGYRGTEHVSAGLLATTLSRAQTESTGLRPDIIVHIGEIGGDYATTNLLRDARAEVWRVSEDGELRDLFGGLRYVFEMPEVMFLEKYTALAHELSQPIESHLAFREAWRNAARSRRIPEDLPLSHPYIAKALSAELPRGSALHLAASRTRHTWNLVEVDPSITVSVNTGGCGIDGPMSTLLGTSLAFPDRLCFGVVGDLAFFYDMNALGNRHVAGNVRILLVNNGLGAELARSGHESRSLGRDVDQFVAAKGHNGSARAWVESMGFRYISARTRAEFQSQMDVFVQPNSDEGEAPLFFEVFTAQPDEDRAISATTAANRSGISGVKAALKDALPPSIKSAAKRALGRP